MLDLSAEEFAQRAFELNLINERQIESVWSQLGTRDIEPDQLRALLLRRELLTNYQIERMLKGEKAGFFYGNYKVLYLVGTGSFARVYRAVHKDDPEKVVALKVLRKRHCESPLQTEKFLHEGRMGMSLRHPNIVPIYEVDSVRRSHFLVMAFVEGQSLREFVQIRRQVGSLEASEIMSGVMSGLNFAGEKGIQHRDLKLSNVLISSEGRPQLVDFGLAIEGDQQQGQVARTVDYAGLEKLTRAPKDDPRSDIYFAGCMYYHLLSGKPPITESRDRQERSNPDRFKEVTKIRDMVADVNPHVEAIVEKSMALMPERRYQKPVDMMVDLQKAIKALASDGETTGITSTDVQRTVMLVESNTNIQDAVRNGLKKQGHRALVISDAERAYQRISANPRAADCLVVSTATLGRGAVELLKQLRANGSTKDVPVVVLAGKSQTKLQQQLKSAKRMQVLSMPLKMSDVTTAIDGFFVDGKSA